MESQSLQVFKKKKKRADVALCDSLMGMGVLGLRLGLVLESFSNFNNPMILPQVTHSSLSRQPDDLIIYMVISNL